MANEIHNYPIEIYTIGDNDYLDVDFYNGVDYDSSKILGANLKASIKAGMYSMINDSTYVTGTAEQDFMDGAYVGSLSVPANTFAQGDAFQLSVCGQIGSHNNDTLTIRIKSGSTILSSSPAIVMPSITLEVFELECTFVIRQIGAAGIAQIMTNTSLNWNKSAANIFEGQNWLYLNNMNFDTTIPNTLQLTAEWSSANAGNHIQSIVANLSKIY